MPSITSDWCPEVCPAVTTVRRRAVTEDVVVPVEQLDVVADVEVGGVVHAELDEARVVPGLPLGPLHEQAGVRHLDVAAAVVEVEVAAHDERDVGRIEPCRPQLRPDAAVGRELGREHRLETVEPVVRVGDVRVHARVEQHEALRGARRGTRAPACGSRRSGR